MAWRPVLAVAGAQLALLLATAGRYGYHRDELYFLVAGRHLAWGYVDQPAFTPLVARVAGAIAPGSLVALRVLPAITAAAAVVAGALIAREMDGGRRAQILAAGAVGGGGFVLGASHILGTAAFDFAASLGLLLAATRLLRTADTRWWVAIGAGVGLATYNKLLVGLLIAGLAGGLLSTRRRRLLWNRHLLIGGLAAAVVAFPNILWQAANGWPQLGMARVIARRIGGENRALLLPGQLLFSGPALAPLLVAGCRRLWLADAGTWRPLLLAWPAALVLTFASAGRPYYPLPFTVLVLVAGVVAAERWNGWGRAAAVVTVAATAAVSLPVSLPLVPPSRLAGTPVTAINEAASEQIGWPQLAAQVAGVVGALPRSERDSVVVLTATYGEAGALERFGPAHGLPLPVSAHNNYWYWRRPHDDEATVVAVRLPLPYLRRWFERCDVVARVDNGLGIENEAQGKPISVCRGLRGPWRTVWEEMRFLS